MMIKKLDATFGKLEGESLELHDGLNVISSAQRKRQKHMVRVCPRNALRR